MRWIWKRAPWVACVLMASCAVFAQMQYPFQNPELPPEKRIENLLSLMTLEEKIDALSTHPAVPRLGVAGSGHIEGLHGVALGGPGGWGGKGKEPLPTTQFPQAIGLGETWDPALIEQAAAVEAQEARFAFQKYHRGAIVVRAPNADLVRDPRWGRAEESYGEDAFLNGTMAVAFTRGLQGKDPKYWETAALLKHFMANSNEDGRDGSSSNFDERLLREYYSVPFRMGIEQGGARAFMTAYNAVNGVPMVVNPILKHVVIREWGFDGIICTDAGALKNTVTAHKFYKTIEDGVAGSIHAGINQFLDTYKDGLHEALAKGLVTEADLDENLKGVYRVMIRLGLLDPPSMVRYAAIGVGASDVDPWMTEQHKQLARKVTEESIVLLRNDGALLPLHKEKLKSIAVIGRYADRVALDWYSGTPPYSISPLDGLRAEIGAGITVNAVTSDETAAAVDAAKKSDVAIVLVGNHPTCDAGWNKCTDPNEGKEAIDRKSIDLPEEALIRAVLTANPKTVVVLVSSFPYAIGWTQEHVPAIVHMSHNSEEQGSALAGVLFGKVNPGGRLTETWPAALSDLPPMMDYDLRDGRTYMYAKAKPLYPFGYGLSYTTFAYSQLHLSTHRLSQGGLLEVTVRVKNTGAAEGDEVVQLYVQHIGSKVTRPKQELKGFQRVTLRPGESKVVELSVAADSLAWWDQSRGKFVVEADRIKVGIGGSSADWRLAGEIAVAQE